MKLEDFVSDTITQITRGVLSAQGQLQDTGALVNPKLQTMGVECSIGEVERRPGERVSLLEFDIALTVSESTETKGGIAVAVGLLGLGSQGTTEKTNDTLSRVKFSVPIVLPIEKTDC